MGRGHWLLLTRNNVDHDRPGPTACGGKNCSITGVEARSVRVDGRYLLSGYHLLRRRGERRKKKKQNNKTNFRVQVYSGFHGKTLQVLVSCFTAKAFIDAKFHALQLFQKLLGIDAKQYVNN
jgi:hypothetical protein